MPVMLAQPKLIVFNEKSMTLNESEIIKINLNLECLIIVWIAVYLGFHFWMGRVGHPCVGPNSGSTHAWGIL